MKQIEKLQAKARQRFGFCGSLIIHFILFVALAFSGVFAMQPPAADAPPVQDGGVWDRLAHCESTGNWQIVSANGLYYGGLQFSKPTWDAYGGQQYANYPNEASREQQIAVATRLRDANGGSYGSWPGCAAKLGLPT